MSATATHADHPLPPEYSAAVERCDGCSARAAYEVALASGKRIYLCGHHTKRNLDQLTSLGSEVRELPH